MQITFIYFLYSPFMIFPCMSLHCKLVPVQYRAYEPSHVESEVQVVVVSFVCPRELVSFDPGHVTLTSNWKTYLRSWVVYRVRIFFQKQISRTFPELFQDSD